jgi:hypothetical protein
MEFKAWVERQNGMVRWSNPVQLRFVSDVRASLTAPSNGATYRPSDTVEITAGVQDCSDCTERVDFYAGETLIGSDSTAPYAVSWRSAPVGTHLLTVRAFDKYGQSVSSDTVRIEVNTPPMVRIDQPASPAVVFTPNALQITASATDPDGINWVQFLYEHNNSGRLELLNTDFYAPYITSWNTIPAGSYRFVARAQDYRGMVTDSEPLLVTVISNQAPVVNLLSPASGTNFDEPASITLTANASDADGSVVSVAFYADGNLLQSDTAAPYTYTWGGVVAGSYTLTAVATDNRGTTSTTAPVTVVVRDNAVDSVSVRVSDCGRSDPAHLPAVRRERECVVAVGCRCYHRNDLPRHWRRAYKNER